MMNFVNKKFNVRINKSLLFKIVVTFLLFSEAISICIVYIVNKNYLNDLKKSTLEQLISTRQWKDLQLKNWILENQDESIVISNSPDLRPKVLNISKIKPEDNDYPKIIADLKNRFKTIIDKNPKIDSIFILDNNKKTLVSVDRQTDSISKNTNKSFDELYRPFSKPENITAKVANSKDNPNISSFYLSIKDRQPIIVYVSPIFDESGNRLANILVNINLSQINNFFVDLINNSNTNNNPNISKQAYLIGKVDNKLLMISGESQIVKGEDEIVRNDAIDNALDGVQGGGEYKNYSRTNVIGSYSWIESLNVALILEVNAQSISEPADRSLRNMILVATGLVLAATAVFYAIVRHRLRSILEMTKLSASISKGNWGLRFPVSQKDEVSALGAAFNHLLSQFKEANEQFIESKHLFAYQVNQSNEVLHRFIDITNEGFAFLDRNYQVLQMNTKLAEILSVSMIDTIATRYDSIFPLEISNLLKSLQSQKLKQDEEIYQIEFSLLNHRNYKAIVSKVFNKNEDNNDRRKFLGTIIIVSEENKLPLSHLLGQSNGTVNMLNTKEVSRKLRTPMTSLVSFLKLTQTKLESSIFPQLDAIDDKTQNTIQQISSNFGIMISEGTQIAMSIEDILQNNSSINNLPTTYPTENLEIFLVSEILNLANVETASLFQEKNRRLLFDIVNVSLAKIEGNREDLKYVFINLLTRVSNLNKPRIAICNARLSNQKITVVIGEVSSLFSHDQTISIIANLYDLIDNTDHKNFSSKEMSLITISEILQKHGGSVRVEWINSNQDSFRFYVVTLPTKGDQ